VKKMDRVVNSIKIALANKKKIILMNTTIKEFFLIKIFLKLNIILFVKKINKNKILIKLNNNFKLKLTSILKKKKLTIKQNSKNIKKNIFIISNNKGICISNNINAEGGLLMFKLNY
jgi:hypothetical protein